MTTSGGDVVTIVDTGELPDSHGDLLTLIDDNGNSYLVAVTDGANFQCILSDLSGHDGVYIPQSYPHICAISRNGDDYEPINPQLLPFLASLGMDFSTSSHGVRLRSGNDTLLSGLGASGCDTEAPENPFYYEEWGEEGITKRVEFLSNETGQGLNCEKTAFNRTEDSSTVVYVMKFNAEPEDIPNWRWYQLAACWLEVRGVPSLIIPMYQPL